MTSRRRRILFILPSLRIGGAERVFVTILRHLDRARFEPHLALLERAGALLSEVPEDVSVHEIRQPRVRFALARIIRLVWKLRPHAILSTLLELNLGMMAARFLFPPGVRLLVRETTTPSAYLAQECRYPKVWEWLYRRTYGTADKIICGADFVLNDLADHIGAARPKLVRIYNPLDIERIRQQASVGASPYSGARPQIVAVGRLSREKGTDVLIDAMSRVRKCVPSAQLTILGEGPLRGYLEGERERLGLVGAIHFAGNQPNPYPYFKHADLFVLSSRFEGMPNAVLEALALGVPVVAVDCPGGVREAVPAGPMCWLVPRPDPRLLGEAIVKAWDSGASRPWSAKNLEDFLGKFAIERTVRAYEDLFLE